MANSTAICYLHHGSSISRLQATCHCAVASVASRKLCKATWSKRSWVEPGITVVSGPGPLEPKGKHREFPWISRVSWKVWWEIYGWNLGFSMVCTIKYGGFPLEAAPNSWLLVGIVRWSNFTLGGPSCKVQSIHWAIHKCNGLSPPGNPDSWLCSTEQYRTQHPSYSHISA